MCQSNMTHEFVKRYLLVRCSTRKRTCLLRLLPYDAPQESSFVDNRRGRVSRFVSIKVW